MSKPNEQFNVEAQFIKYLNLRGIRLADLNPPYLQELRRAFYGGFAGLISLMDQELDGLLVTTDQYKSMLGITEQLRSFWNKEANITPKNDGHS